MASCTYSVPDKDATGDNLYGGRICSQPMVDYFWQAYGFNGNSNYWDDGFGFEAPCDTNKPLARAFNGCWLLTYSAEDFQNDNYQSNALHWGRRYVRDNIDNLRSRCGDGSAIARALSGGLVEVYLGFFYNKDVPGRAETLIHEARHQGGKPHNATFPSGSVFGGGEGGADSSWDFKGAWMYGALYLWWFFADGRRTTSAMKQRARQRGNLVINNAFAQHPGFNI